MSKPLALIEQHVLETLWEVGRRLTTSQLLSAMEERGHRWDESTVKGRLAIMVDNGLLASAYDADAMERGYVAAVPKPRARPDAPRQRPAPPAASPGDRLISADQVAYRLSISRRTLYRQLRAGQIPQACQRRRGMAAKWRASDIDDFIASLIEDAVVLKFAATSRRA